MAHANIYIRKENEFAWDAVEDKSAWVNARLGDKQPKPATERVHIEPKANDSVYTTKPDVYTKPIVKDIAKAVDEFKPCKHGYDPKFCKQARPGKPCK